jgi:hypothetical protein
MNIGKTIGVWMDSNHATIATKEQANESYKIVAHVKGKEVPSNSNENSSNNHARTLQVKFFKEISAHLTNAGSVHVTGTGKEQEQFIRYLSETPQFKNMNATHSTSNEMSDEKLVEFFEKN